MVAGKAAAGAVRQYQVMVGNLNRGVRFAPRLPDSFKQLGHTAAIARMIAAKATTIRIKRQSTHTRYQVAIGYEWPALTFGTKTEIFELNDDGDRETVVDRDIFHV